MHKLEVGDIITTKKPHPCGGNEWDILRIGADIVIKCKTCNRQIWIDREKLQKNIKKVTTSNN